MSNRKTVFRLASLTALLLASATAQAGTMTLTGWTFGSGNAVSAAAPTYNGQAGGFSGTFNDGSSTFAIDTYCVDLGQTFGFNTGYTGYNSVTALSAFGNAKSTMLGRLISYVTGTAGAVDTAAESTSMQLAIWNIIYDNDLTLGSGTFADTSGYAGYASTLLSNASGYGLTKDLFVLASSSNQDQIYWRDLVPGTPSNASVIPEPASLALVGLALGGLAIARRRRAG